MPSERTNRAARILETSRLSLRELSEDDAPALLELYREPSVSRFLGPPPGSEADERANIHRHREVYYERRGFGLWGIELKVAHPRLVGRCGLLVTEIAGRSEVEISWVVAPEYQGRGLATEAARAVLGHAQTTLKQRRIVAVIAPGNHASIRVAHRLGMRLITDVPYRELGSVHLYLWDGAANLAAGT